MCLIAIAWRPTSGVELLVAANRDEFHDRPAAAAAPWPQAQHVVGGRDLSAGGSWLALSAHGRLAAVTNVRRMVQPDPQAPSRGGLVAAFVSGAQSAPEFLRALAPQAARYSAFNLLLWDADGLYYTSNQDGHEQQTLQPGIHMISNAHLDTPWPKTIRLRLALAQWLAAPDLQSPDALFAALADDRAADDHDLPDTGVGLEMERFLSPPFIRGPRYGTRASTVVLVRADGTAEFHERRFTANGVANGDSSHQLVMGR